MGDWQGFLCFKVMEDQVKVEARKLGWLKASKLTICEKIGLRWSKETKVIGYDSVIGYMKSTISELTNPKLWGQELDAQQMFVHCHTLLKKIKYADENYWP